MLVKGGAPLPRSERHHRRCPTDGTHHRGMCGAQLPRRERHQRVWVGKNAVLTCSRVPFKGTRWEPGRNQEGTSNTTEIPLTGARVNTRKEPRMPQGPPWRESRRNQAGSRNTREPLLERARVGTMKEQQMSQSLCWMEPLGTRLDPGKPESVR